MRLCEPEATQWFPLGERRRPNMALPAFTKTSLPADPERLCSYLLNNKKETEEETPSKRQEVPHTSAHGIPPSSSQGHVIYNLSGVMLWKSEEWCVCSARWEITCTRSVFVHMEPPLCSTLRKTPLTLQHAERFIFGAQHGRQELNFCEETLQRQSVEKKHNLPTAQRMLGNKIQEEERL